MIRDQKLEQTCINAPPLRPEGRHVSHAPEHKRIFLAQGLVHSKRILQSIFRKVIKQSPSRDAAPSQRALHGQCSDTVEYTIHDAE